MLEFEIKEGFWTDHALDGAKSSVLTLSSQHAAMLIAFVAVFAGLVGTRLWIILAYAIHQLQATSRFKRIFSHQIQAIVRNTDDPWQSAVELVCLTWAWRKDARAAAIRAGLLVLTAVSVGVGIMAFGLSVPNLITYQLDASIGYGLVKSAACGLLNFHMPSKSTNPKSVATAYGYVSWEKQKYTEAQTYAETCYSSDRASSLCNILPTRSLPFSIERNVTCQVDPYFCDEYPTMRLNTGYISSNSLGINSHAEDEVFYRRVATCSPLYLSDSTGEALDGKEFARRFGPSSIDPKDELILVELGGIENIQPYTYLYQWESISVGLGYQINAFTSAHGWLPIPELNRSDGDSILFLTSQNRVIYTGKSHDPIFWATNPYIDETIAHVYYLPQYGVRAISCVEQFQFCTADEKCTPLHTLTDVSKTKSLVLNQWQSATVERIRLLESQNGIHQPAGMLGENALLANKQVNPSDKVSMKLPDHQWELEVQYWFNITLAQLQVTVAEIAAQPPNTHGQVLNDTIPGLLGQCGSQKIKGNGLYQSFSVLALGLLFGIGLFIIVISLCIERVGHVVQTIFRAGVERTAQYSSDHFIQLQRQGFEDAGARDWRADRKGAPVPDSDVLVAKRLDQQTGRSRYRVWAASTLRDPVGVEASERGLLKPQVRIQTSDLDSS